MLPPMFVRNKREINVEEEPHRFRSANSQYAESLSLPIHRERKRERERAEEIGGEIGREKEKAYGVKFRVREVTLPRKHLTARLLIIRHVVAKRVTMTLFTP